ncbi:unnamed protein product [Darwinula stevensoni]|uniref:UMP-CMP kinase n=1 Tax=Darwinula stevensoni TaxID=69355 RepID=A0A7R8XEH3_9CRUS|nr:unnamed protein product [Darwinula stevensoni]CAG0895766.1 unnamed protein product [Darwinula stevensoni]
MTLWRFLRAFSQKMTKPQVVFVLGAPGAGKGTQCANIVQDFNFVHLSAGDLLREERNRPGSEFGEMIENCIAQGTIVPVEVTCSLLERAMQESGKSKFLIDGFPRNEDNLTGWERQMHDKADVRLVLSFDCSEEVCTRRCLDRGAAGSGRIDDNAESLKKRFDTFYNSTMPIIQHYEKLNLLRKIDGDKAPDEVFQEVKTILMKESLC